MGLSKNRKANLTEYEKEILMAQLPDSGQIVYIIRDHPHVSKDHPFWHIDILYFEFVCEDNFIFLYKDHLPVEEPS